MAPMTNAERQKKYRQKLKQNSRQYEEKKKRHREYMRSVRQPIRELSEDHQYWRKLTWQDKKSMMKKRALTNPEQVTELPPLLPQIQSEINVPETPVPGPSNAQESAVNIEDIFQASSTIKLELDNLDTSDSDDPLNFGEECLVSDPAFPEPEPEPEIEQPRNTARDRSRRRIRRVLRRPLTQSRLDVINHITVNEVKKALIQKNEIKKQFYAEYMVEIRKQTQALVSIAKRLSNNR